MADFEVRTDSLRDVSEQLNRIHHQVREISDDAKRIFLNTRGSITARLAMHLQRAVVCANINNCATDLKNVSNTLNKVASIYESSEKRVLNAELFDEVNRPWYKDLIAILPDIPIIGPVFPKPVIRPTIWDLIIPWRPVVIPWKPTYPPTKFWGPWSPWQPFRPIHPRPWIIPWKPAPPKPPIVYAVGKDIITGHISGPGGQNPIYRNGGSGIIATSLFKNVVFASVGTAVRMA